MNAEASSVVVNCVCGGVFNTLEAIASASFEHSAGEVQPVSEEQLAASLKEYPIILQGRLPENLGGMALLLTTHDALYLLALTKGSGAEAEDSLSDEDRGVLKEIAETAIGGGLSQVMEYISEEPLSVEGIDAVEAGEGSAGQLVKFVGSDTLAAEISYSTEPDFSANALLVFGSKLPERIPKEAAQAGSDNAGAQAALSPEEMSDILGGLGPDSESEAWEEAPGGTSRKEPGNLEMILDIRLRATARLGRVEMPIAEILGLGPGSIIEVGQLVDEPIELLINNKPIARGDVVVVGEQFGLRITEILSARERIERLA